MKLEGLSSLRQDLVNAFLCGTIWHPAGILFQKYGFRTIYDAASSFEAKLEAVLKNKTLNWVPTRPEDLVDIQSKLFLVESWPP